jgi:hypothetical protein
MSWATDKMHDLANEQEPNYFRQMGRALERGAEVAWQDELLATSKLALAYLQKPFPIGEHVIDRLTTAIAKAEGGAQ